MIKTLIKKKKGEGDIIASLFVIMAMILFVLYFINAIGDVNTRTHLDQIARKYILRMESSGELTSEEVTAIKTECMSIRAVQEATGGDMGQIEVTWNNNEGAKGYGSSITLKIVCPALTTGFDSSEENDETEEQSMYGGFLKKKTYYTITKQSTAKY